MMTNLVPAVVVGAGATLCIDLWSWFLRRAFAIRSLDYCLLGRWLLHMPGGQFRHARIATAAPQPGECVAGWAAHYSIGIGFAIVFTAWRTDWMAHPTLLPALAFGIITVLVPFLTLQPAFGLGIAASKAPHPWPARLKSLATHAVFGCGLYATAVLLRLAA